LYYEVSPKGVVVIIVIIFMAYWVGGRPINSDPKSYWVGGRVYSVR